MSAQLYVVNAIFNKYQEIKQLDGVTAREVTEIT
jgi:hypothetical protein